MINYLQQLHKAGINNTFEALLLAAIAKDEGCCIDDLMQRLAIKKNRSNYEKVKIRLHKMPTGVAPPISWPPRWPRRIHGGGSPALHGSPVRPGGVLIPCSSTAAPGVVRFAPIRSLDTEGLAVPDDLKIVLLIVGVISIMTLLPCILDLF
mgnify:CR=1 FL=1